MTDPVIPETHTAEEGWRTVCKSDGVWFDRNEVTGETRPHIHTWVPFGAHNRCGAAPGEPMSPLTCGTLTPRATGYTAEEGKP